MLLGLAQRLLPAWIYDRLFGRFRHEGLKRYTSSTAWMLFARIVNTIIGFLAGIYVIRSLGPENYGQLSYAISFVSFFGIIGSLGIDSILPRDLVAHPEKRNRYLGTALGIKIFMGVIAAAGVTITSSYITDDYISKILTFILAPSFVFIAFHIITYEFSARVEQKYISIILVLITLLLNGLKIAVIFSGNGIIYLAFLLLFESILYAGSYVLMRTIRYGSITTWSFDRNIAKQLIIDSWPFIFIAIFTTVYSRIDQVMLKHLIDAEAVGLYDAAVRIAEAWLIVPMVITASLFPAIVNARSTNSGEYLKRLLILATVLGSCSIIVASITTIMAPMIIVFLYGEAFTASILPFIIYMWGVVLAAIDIVARHYLVAENKRMSIFIITAGAAVSNIALNYLLIPPFGIVGAAIATLIAYLILTFPIVNIASKYLHYRKSTLPKPALYE